jgi:hypothetical protein
VLTCFLFVLVFQSSFTSYYSIKLVPYKILLHTLKKTERKKNSVVIKEQSVTFPGQDTDGNERITSRKQELGSSIYSVTRAVGMQATSAKRD